MTGINATDAYRKGQEASRRTVTGDMDAAEARFTARYGSEYADAWIAGWSDYSVDGVNRVTDWEGENDRTVPSFAHFTRQPDSTHIVIYGTPHGELLASYWSSEERAAAERLTILNMGATHARIEALAELDALEEAPQQTARQLIASEASRNGWSVLASADPNTGRALVFYGRGESSIHITWTENDSAVYVAYRAGYDQPATELHAPMALVTARKLINREGK